MSSLSKIWHKIVVIILAVIMVAAFREAVLTDAVLNEGLAKLLGSFPFASFLCGILKKIADGSNMRYVQYVDYIRSFSTDSMIVSIAKTLILALLKPLFTIVITMIFLPLPSFSGSRDPIDRQEAYMKSPGYVLKKTFLMALLLPILVFFVNWLMASCNQWVINRFGAVGKWMMGAGGGVVIVILMVISALTFKGISFGKALLAKTGLTLLPKVLDILVTNFLCYFIYTSAVAGVASQAFLAIGGLFIWLIGVDIMLIGVRKILV